MSDSDNGRLPSNPLLRVLILEDSEDDTLLNLRLLRAGGWDVKWERVDNEEDYLHCLESRPDIIISDHTMPHLDAKRALEVLNTSGLDIPFIIVSGTIEPREAVELMQAGARDYLSKNDLARLVAVVRRELHEAETRRQRRAVEAETRKLSNVVEQTSNAIFITDREGTIEYANTAFEAISGYSKGEVVGKKPNLLKSDKHDAAYFQNMWETILKGSVFQDVIINRKKNGSLYYEEKTISPLKDEAGNVTHFISTGTDITDKLQIQERLQYLAYHDILTELPNRAQLMNRLEYALLRCQRTGDHFALLLLNLDRFKIINDTLGREVGDDVLQIQVSRLKGLIGEGNTVARLIGDEFAVLVEDVKSLEGIPSLAQNTLDILSQPIKMGNHEFFIGASMGISLYPEDGDDSLLLLRCADSALHRAKEQGGNSYQFYSPEMSSKAFERLGMEARLRRALEKREFLLYYHPQVDIRNGEIACLEALLRWQDPESGMIQPAKFIPLLEETGLIVSIGQWILEEACKAAMKWRTWAYKHVRVAVNLSAHQFNDHNLSSMVLRILNETGLPPEMLELEITESTIMHNAQQIIDTLKSLSGIGVRLAIDDFGTGYSSLAYLKRFPVDTLKIDRSFVQDIIHDPDSFSIAKSIIALAHSLNLEVVAEGIETDSQLRMLQLLNCELIQGYYFSRPLPEEDLEKLMLMHAAVKLPDLLDTGGNRALLVVDDDHNTLSSLKRLLRKEDYEVLSASTGEEGLQVLAEHDVGVILSDQRMPGMSGIEFLNRVKSMYPDCIRMILSGYMDLNTVMEAVNKGHIYKFIAKPWEDDFLLISIREAFDAYNTRKFTNAAASPVT